MKYSKLGVAAVFLFASACATATTTVMAPPDGQYKNHSIAVSHGTDTIEVDEDASTRFEEKLLEILYAEGAFSEGAGLTLEYRFIQFDKGSQAARYIIGMGVGKGSMTIEVLFLDASGTELARVHTGGEISAGLFGGSFGEAVDTSATEVAEYAIANFLGAPTDDESTDTGVNGEEDSTDNTVGSGDETASVGQLDYASTTDQVNSDKIRQWLDGFQDQTVAIQILKQPTLLALVGDYFDVLGEPEALQTAVNNGAAVCMSACREYGVEPVFFGEKVTTADFLKMLMQTRFGYIESESNRWRALARIDNVLRAVDLNDANLSAEDAEYLSGEFRQLVEKSSGLSGKSYPVIENLIAFTSRERQ